MTLPQSTEKRSRRSRTILRTQFTGLTEETIAKVPDQLRNPLKYQFRSVVFVAEHAQAQIRGFTLLLHAPDLDFCYLEYLSAAPGATSGGIGSALYERVRLAALVLGAIGLFLESLPDDPSLFLHPVIRKQNAARLRFYERYGARPIAGTAYETPLTLGDDNPPPYLVFDGTFVQNNFARTPDVWKENQNLTFLVQNA